MPPTRVRMRYDADRRRGGLVFRRRKRQTAALVSGAIAMGYGCHCSRCGERVGQSRRHDQEGGVSIVGEAGPRRGRQDPCHQDCSSRSAARCAPEYGHPRRIRGLHSLVNRRTPCALAHLPERVARTSVGATFRVMRSWARAPATGSPRALAYAAPTATPTRAAGSRTAQRSPSTRTSGASRRRTSSSMAF